MASSATSDNEGRIIGRSVNTCILPDGSETVVEVTRVQRPDGSIHETSTAHINPARPSSSDSAAGQTTAAATTLTSSSPLETFTDDSAPVPPAQVAALHDERKKSGTALSKNTKSRRPQGPEIIDDNPAPIPRDRIGNNLDSKRAASDASKKSKSRPTPQPEVIEDNDEPIPRDHVPYDLELGKKNVDSQRQSSSVDSTVSAPLQSLKSGPRLPSFVAHSIQVSSTDHPSRTEENTTNQTTSIDEEISPVQSAQMLNDPELPIIEAYVVEPNEQQNENNHGSIGNTESTNSYQQQSSWRTRKQFILFGVLFIIIVVMAGVIGALVSSQMSNNGDDEDASTAPDRGPLLDTNAPVAFPTSSMSEPPTFSNLGSSVDEQYLNTVGPAAIPSTSPSQTIEPTIPPSIAPAFQTRSPTTLKPATHPSSKPSQRPTNTLNTPLLVCGSSYSDAQAKCISGPFCPTGSGCTAGSTCFSIPSTSCTNVMKDQTTPSPTIKPTMPPSIAPAFSTESPSALRPTISPITTPSQRPTSSSNTVSQGIDFFVCGFSYADAQTKCTSGPFCPTSLRNCTAGSACFYIRENSCAPSSTATPTVDPTSKSDSTSSQAWFGTDFCGETYSDAVNNCSIDTVCLFGQCWSGLCFTGITCAS